MRKRTQDGYVLVFVLVVILVVLALCGVACTAAMRNLKSQQASIEDLQSRLNAAGKVEEVYGRLVNLISADLPMLNETKNGSAAETAGAAAESFKSDIYSILKDATIKAVSPYSLEADTKILKLEFEIDVSASGDDSDTHVEATMKLEAALHGETVMLPQSTETPDPAGETTATPIPTEGVDPPPEPTEAPPAQGTYTIWKLTGVKVSYDSYHVSTAEGEGDSP